MATAVDPLLIPEAWDHVTISGVDSPGIVEVTSAARANRWDVKDGAGSGATATFKGFKLAEPVLTFTFWREGDYANWAAFEDLFRFDPLKGQSRAFDIYHPALEAVGVRSCVVQEIGQPVFEKGGKTTIQIKLLEYRPPPPTNPTKTPEGSKPANAKNGTKTTPTAQDAKSQEIQKLLNQYNSLPDTLSPDIEGIQY